MGVTSLWPILEPVKKSATISSLSGQTLAIDLSSWIVESRQLSVASGFTNIYLRNLLLRTSELLKYGVRPVFVVDGHVPTLKDEVMQQRQKNSGFSSPVKRERQENASVIKSLTLLDFLGVPWIQSSGEAEALCALLNKEGVVDGCMTSDNDCLLYGATVVYRNYTKENKVSAVDSYGIDDIQDKLGLCRTSMVALSLFIGCDYNKRGIRQVGSEKAMRLIKELKKKNLNVLDRIFSWRENQNLIRLQMLKNSREKSGPHCRRCHHIGTLSSHNVGGCEACGQEKSCTKSSEPLDDNSCSCTWHQKNAELNVHKYELLVREKALEDKNFPSQEIVDEFLSHAEKLPEKEFTWKEPNYQELQGFLSEHLHWSGEKMMETLLPVMVYWKTHDVTYSSLNSFEPTKIIKSCRKNFRYGYEVEWSKLAEDKWTEKECYTVFVGHDDFSRCFPNMARIFENSISPGGQKRKGIYVEEKTSIKNYFSVKKQFLSP